MAHVHIDQNNDPDEHETPILIEKVKQHQMEGRVVAVHGISIAAQPLQDRLKIYQGMREAQIALITCPKAWMDAKRNEKLAPTHNSIAPIDELVPAGIKIALGSDNTSDIYLPANFADMWEEVDMILTACRYRDVDMLADIASVNGLNILGLPQLPKN